MLSKLVRDERTPCDQKKFDIINNKILTVEVVKLTQHLSDIPVRRIGSTLMIPI
jgi:hypothetical protein